MIYYRAIAQTDCQRTKDALPLAGGWCWFDRVEIRERRRAPEIVPASEVPSDVLGRMTSERAVISGLSMDVPRLMGILNVTPDSFSDGGLFTEPVAALEQARAMQSEGADIIDVGGESTRPGAQEVVVTEEISRTAPVISAIRAGSDVPISIDTRKSMVARSAIGAGASLLNDVSAFSFDAAMKDLCAQSGLPICLMHAQGTPETMQHDPTYKDVLLDIYDFLQDRIDIAEQAGIDRSRVIVDPGIGFGKTLEHNLTLLKNISLFHSLGCPILVGASRKRFIGTLTGVEDASDRLQGSVAVAVEMARQGVQILRVHDVKETRQALKTFNAMMGTA